eukprot:scaffold54_cov113-Isochrysis_galbana.AAC.3
MRGRTHCRNCPAIGCLAPAPVSSEPTAAVCGQTPPDREEIVQARVRNPGLQHIPPVGLAFARRLCGAGTAWGQLVGGLCQRLMHQEAARACEGLLLAEAEVGAAEDQVRGGCGRDGGRDRCALGQRRKPSRHLFRVSEGFGSGGRHVRHSVTDLGGSAAEVEPSCRGPAPVVAVQQVVQAQPAKHCLLLARQDARLDKGKRAGWTVGQRSGDGVEQARGLRGRQQAQSRRGVHV